MADVNKPGSRKIFGNVSLKIQRTTTPWLTPRSAKGVFFRGGRDNNLSGIFQVLIELQRSVLFKPFYTLHKWKQTSHVEWWWGQGVSLWSFWKEVYIEEDNRFSYHQGSEECSATWSAPTVSHLLPFEWGKNCSTAENDSMQSAPGSLLYTLFSIKEPVNLDLGLNCS